MPFTHRVQFVLEGRPPFPQRQNNDRRACDDSERDEQQVMQAQAEAGPPSGRADRRDRQR